MPDPVVVSRIFTQARVIAVVGFSSKPSRAGYYVPAYLQRAGYDILPVNPRLESGLGKQSFPDLLSIPVSIDGVVIFRRPEHIPAIVEQAIQVGAWFIWMQLGLVHEQAGDTARRAGLEVVMDACMMVEHRRYVGQMRRDQRGSG
jgi:predicted CoA-binding protein